jgi:endo-1,4-beta-xylanase
MRTIRHKRWAAAFVVVIVAVVLVLAHGAVSRICRGAPTGGKPFVGAVPLGAAVSWQAVKESPAYGQFFLDHYEWMTPENETKMNALEPKEGTFEFKTADAMVNWAIAHGKHVHGHVLIWDSQLPAWLKPYEQLSPAKALQIMKTYIQTVLRHFRGRIDEWDVVNEAIKPDGAIVHNLWYKALGPDYIRDAFAIARATDPHVRLCYNDDGTELPGPHANAVLRLVKQLRAEHLIDCVGFEMHTTVPGPPERVMASEFRRFAATGVDVLISELDVKLTAGQSLGAQANVYSDVARACRSVRGCDRVTTWGFTDANSWLGSSARALPFNASCQAKPAWTALTTALATTKPARG